MLSFIAKTCYFGMFFFLKGDNGNLGVTSSDGRVGRLVGKRKRKMVVFYGINMIY